MCWFIDKDKNPEIYHKIAQEDIKVYKFGNFWDVDKCFHPYFYDLLGYKINDGNKEVKLKIHKYFVTCKSWSKGSDKFVITDGYHSYSGECLYDGNQHILEESYPFASHVGIFIIPKGSEYYKNENGEIVSSNIIWTGEYISSKQNKKAMIKLKDYVLVYK